MQNTDSSAPAAGSQTTGPRPDSRERAQLRALVELADGLANGWDRADLLHRLTRYCTQLFGAEAAAILLAESPGSRSRLQVITASSGDLADVEALAVDLDEGPCVDCVHTGTAVSVPDLRAPAISATWPRWTARAAAGGIESVYALPMRLRDQVIGALTMTGTRPAQLSADDLSTAQAAADIATITVLTQDALVRSTVLNTQLQTALDSRVVIEQAKGVIATALGTTMADAFDILRTTARSTNTRITELAHHLTTGRVAATDLRRRPPERRSRESGSW